ncbi:hypothetical protein LCGC14_0651160 [marine sediment metagenome]|uniref:Uncharacterized protein n=1 Tax=marine sediment metagenome TaxID=412755 RepID=A0A0F9RG18_9ZZZZ
MTFTVVVTEKFRKGTDARALGTFPTAAAAQKFITEAKFVSRRGSPSVVETSKVQSFIASRQTGIFKPSFVAPTGAELKAKAEREKAASKVERLRATAKGELIIKDSPLTAAQQRKIALQSLAARGFTGVKLPEQTQKQFLEARTLQQLSTGETATFQFGVQAPRPLTRQQRLESLFAATGAARERTAAEREQLELAALGFAPSRPIAAGETMILPSLDLLDLSAFQRPARAGVIETRKDKPFFDIGKITDFTGVIPKGQPIQETISIITPSQFSLDFSVVEFGAATPFIQPKQETITLPPPDFFGKPPKLSAETAKLEKETREILGLEGRVTQLKAELFLEGVPKAIEAAPLALGFFGLAVIAPPAITLTVGVGATALSIPAFQEEIGKKGLIRTLVSESLVFAEFAAAGGFGAKLRTSARFREAAFDIKLEELTFKDIDPTFTFEKKPFLIEAEKPPKFLQRTIEGEVITPKQLEEKLSILETEILEPTTPKELRRFLGQVEKAQISREQAAIERGRFTPETEEVFKLAGTEGLVTPRKLGALERQLQLRESFATKAQLAAFALREIPTGKPPPPRQKVLIGEVFGLGGLIPPQRILISDIFTGTFKQFPKPKRELPEILEPEVITGTRRRLDFPLLLGTGIFADVFADVKTDQLQQLRQLQQLDLSSIEAEILAQDTRAVLDVDILQIQALESRTAQEVIQDQLLEQKQRQRALLVEDLLFDTFPKPLRITTPKKPPKKPPKRIKPPKILVSDLDLDVVLPGGPGFDVLVREKGKDIEFDTKRSFPSQRANNIGADIVDNSAAASFRIRRSKQPIDSVFDDNTFLLRDKFKSPSKKSKLPPNQLVEKKTFRIDTPGELRGITAKGLIAKRKKQRRSGKNIIGNLLKTNGGNISGIF